MHGKSFFVCWGLVAICVLCSSCAPFGGTQESDVQVELSEALDQLEERWSVECSSEWISSSRETPCTKPAFREIVALGPSVAPLIANRIKRQLVSNELTFDPMKFDTQLLPWVRVLEAVTGHHLKDDPAYREQILDGYRKHHAQGIMVLDPKGEAYEPEIAIPMMLKWWEEEGEVKFNANKH